MPAPLQRSASTFYSKVWRDFFEWASSPVSFDPREMNVTTGKDVAFVTATLLCAGAGAGAGADGVRTELDVRLTIGLRKLAGRWTVVHEHHSVPAS